MIRETAYRLLRHEVSGKTGLMVWHMQGMGIGSFIVVLSYFLLFKSFFVCVEGGGGGWVCTD